MLLALIHAALQDLLEMYDKYVKTGSNLGKLMKLSKAASSSNTLNYSLF